jgi:hypothetical protein
MVPNADEVAVSVEPYTPGWVPLLINIVPTLYNPWVSFVFYRNVWDIIKRYLMNLFHDFHVGKLDIFRFNFARLLNLIHKNDSKELKMYMTMTLANCNSNFFKHFE